MAAAVATLNVLRREDAPARMQHTGQMLRDGLEALSQRHDIPIRQTGPVQMPLVLFEDDADNRKGRSFCTAALRAGVYFHPRHNMFVSRPHRGRYRSPSKPPNKGSWPQQECEVLFFFEKKNQKTSAYFPFHTGGRFSRKALMPSRKSSLM